MASIDDIINGTFNSLGSSATSGWTPPRQTYQPGMKGRGLPMSVRGSPYMTAEESAAFNSAYSSPIYSYAPSAPGNPAASAAASIASNSIPLPRRSPLVSTRMEDDQIAQGVMPGMPRNPAVASVSAPMKETGIGDGLMALLTGGVGGGLMDQITGPSKNGLGGLAGLLGGPEQGGLIQMLMGGMKPAPVAPRRASPSQSYDDANANARARALATATRAPKTSSSKNNDGSWATGETSGSPFW